MTEFDFNKIYPPLPKTPEPYREELKPTREELMKDWNDEPKVKRLGIKAVKKINYNILIFFGVVGILIIALSLGVYSWLAYKDGTLLPKPSLFTCGNISISCPQIPACPQQNCPSINCPDVVCGACNVPDNLNVVITNSS